MPARRSSAEVADREARALDLRRQGATYAQIGDRIGVTEAAAYKIVKRVLDRVTVEAAPDVRKLEADRLDQFQLAALAVLRRQHYTVSGGQIVKDDDGRPLVDDGPTLQAIRTLLSVQERRAKLLGLDAPARVDMKVLTVDMLDARIAELQAQLADNDRQATDAALPTGG